MSDLTVNDAITAGARALSASRKESCGLDGDPFEYAEYYELEAGVILRGAWPILSASLRALHTAETRWSPHEGSILSFAHPSWALDHTEDPDATEDDLHSFTVCRHCGALESDHDGVSEYHFSLWPCRTAQLIHDIDTALGIPAREGNLT